MAERCTKLMVIRHAEKPDRHNGGVTEAGREHKDELIVKGWQRAGALVRFFNPSPATMRPGLAVPGAIFAASPTDEYPSKRPLATVRPLGSDLVIPINSDFAVHQEKALVAAALDTATTVLICWHHERIPNLLSELGVTIEPWPEDVFDRVLVLDRAGDSWTLTVVLQRLLPGDSWGR